MKLNEGEIHDFQVIKLVNIPDEGDFFMLRHHSGRRLLLPCNTYKNYDIKLSENIKCRIDKVSCTGKVYLEPEHPFYKESQEYEFEISKIEYREDGPSALYVTDCFGNLIKVLVSKEFQVHIGKKVNLKVERLKKGVPLLTTPIDADRNEELRALIGKRFEFDVVGISKNDENDEVYILKNSYGHGAEIKIKHFRNYGISVGYSITCEVYGFSHWGILKVEPENPFYKLGEIYEFEIEKNNPLDQNSDEEDEFFALDKYGNKCGIRIRSEILSKMQQKTRAKCRVTGYRKGRPKLELLGLVE